MNVIWISCLIPFLILIFLSTRSKKEMQHIAKINLSRKNGDTKMQELAKKFIGMDVYMKTVGGEVADGILKEVVDNAAVLEKNEKIKVINLDYVISLMEYPKNKKGKRKALVAD